MDQARPDTDNLLHAAVQAARVLATAQGVSTAHVLALIYNIAPDSDLSVLLERAPQVWHT